MKKTRICAVQCKVTDDFKKNLSRVEEFFKRAKGKKADIICFPEVFLTGGMLKKKYDPKIPKKAKADFSRLSKKYKIYSIMGSIIEKIGKNHYNISYIFDDKGKIIGSYRKNHLVQDSEASYLKAGDDVKVFRTKIGNIGIQICRDLLYPEITRKLMLKGAEIVFCPSFWCSRATSYGKTYNDKYFKNKIPGEVTLLASARAIESEVAFVYVNASGTFNYENKNILLGKTQVALPFYGTTKILKNNKEGMLFADVEPGMLKDAKKVYRIEKDLKNYYRS